MWLLKSFSPSILSACPPVKRSSLFDIVAEEESMDRSVPVNSVFGNGPDTRYGTGPATSPDTEPRTSPESNSSAG